MLPERTEPPAGCDTSLPGALPRTGDGAVLSAATKTRLLGYRETLLRSSYIGREFY
jgi:hypothetical protein